jgi:hypothetical protein
MPGDEAEIAYIDVLGRRDTGLGRGTLDGKQRRRK